MRMRFSGTYSPSVVGGAAIGLMFGAKALRAVETVLGDPLCDIVLGVGGGIARGLAPELVASFCRTK